MSESDKPEENPANPTPPTPEEVAQQGGRGEPMDPNGPVNTDYQDTDIDLDTVKKFILVSFAVTIAFFIVMIVVQKFIRKGFEEERGVATVEDRQIPGKDDALLQTRPLEDKAAYDELEAQRLNTLTNAGVHAVIPVESAKALMLKDGFAHSEAEEPAEVAVVEASEPMEPVVPAIAVVEPKTTEASAPATEVAAVVMQAPSFDPAFVAAGKKIWEAQCAAACHTGKRGAIGPNIVKKFGTMRKLQDGTEVLMDKEYVIHSMMYPNDQIAKGYMPVMMSFKDLLTPVQKEQVAAYLATEGKPIPKPAPVVAEEAKPAEPAAEPAVEPVMAEKPVVPEVVPEPAAAPVEEVKPAPAAPAPAPAPAKPTPKPAAPKGTIFV